MNHIEPLYFYHLVPKNAKLDKHGLITPEYMWCNKIFNLYAKSVDKYRDRLVNGWNIYPNRDPNDLTLYEIHEGINIFRKDPIDGNNVIYFFKYLPYYDLGPNMKETLLSKRAFRIDINNPLTKSYIKDIFYGYDLSHTDNEVLTKEYYQKINRDEYFSRYNDNDPLKFRTLNHIGIIPKRMYLPMSILVEVKI